VLELAKYKNKPEFLGVLYDKYDNEGFRGFRAVFGEVEKIEKDIIDDKEYITIMLNNTVGYSNKKNHLCKREGEGFFLSLDDPDYDFFDSPIIFLDEVKEKSKKFFYDNEEKEKIDAFKYENIIGSFVENVAMRSHKIDTRAPNL